MERAWASALIVPVVSLGRSAGRAVASLAGGVRPHVVSVRGTGRSGSVWALDRPVADFVVGGCDVHCVVEGVDLLVYGVQAAESFLGLGPLGGLAPLAMVIVF